MGKFLLMGKFSHGRVLANGHVLAHGCRPGPGPWASSPPQPDNKPLSSLKRILADLDDSDYNPILSKNKKPLWTSEDRQKYRHSQQVVAVPSPISTPLPPPIPPPIPPTPPTPPTPTRQQSHQISEFFNPSSDHESEGDFSDAENRVLFPPVYNSDAEMSDDDTLLDPTVNPLHSRQLNWKQQVREEELSMLRRKFLHQQKKFLERQKSFQHAKIPTEEAVLVPALVPVPVLANANTNTNINTPNSISPPPIPIPTPIPIPITIPSLNFDSMQKIALLSLSTLFVSFLSVTPSTLPLLQYKKEMLRNFYLICLSGVFPTICYLLLLVGRANPNPDSNTMSSLDYNKITSFFHCAVTFGFPLIFVLEIFACTIVRLIVFCIWENEDGLWGLCPEVPVFILPWVLKREGYRPKRITLFAGDFFTSCVVCPVIEEVSE